MEPWDDTWFGRLYDENYDRIKRVIQRTLNNPAIAEELVHETFLNLLVKKQSLMDAGHTNIAGWLVETARRLTMNELRRFRHRHEVPLLEDAIVGIIEREERLEESLPNEMPEMERQVLVWFYEDRLDICMIAKQMGIPEATVRSKLYRARQRYKKFLEKDRNGETNHDSAYIDK